jgi:hypothetical protein
MKMDRTGNQYKKRRIVFIDRIKPLIAGYKRITG